MVMLNKNRETKRMKLKMAKMASTCGMAACAEGRGQKACTQTQNKTKKTKRRANRLRHQPVWTIPFGHELLLATV